MNQFLDSWLPSKPSNGAGYSSKKLAAGLFGVATVSYLLLKRCSSVNSCDKNTTGYQRRLLSQQDPIQTDCPPTTAESMVRKDNKKNEEAFIYESSYQLNSRGEMIYTGQWFPKLGNMNKNEKINNEEDKIKGIIVLCHGYCNYLGGYTFDLCKKLCMDGKYIIFGIEYTGHGRSDGIHGYVPSFDDIAIDVIQFASKFIAKQDIDLDAVPVYLMGISLGGAIVLETIRQCVLYQDPDDTKMDEKKKKKKKRNFKQHAQLHGQKKNSDSNKRDYARYFYNKLTGIVLCAPLIGIDKDLIPNQIIQSLVKFLNYCMPQLALINNSKELYQYSSQNQEYFDRIEGNPMFYIGKLRVGTSMEILRKLILYQSDEYCKKFTKPLLIVHGKDDKICDPKLSEHFYKNCASTKKQLKLFDNTWHYPFMEPTKDEIFDQIFRWLGNH